MVHREVVGGHGFKLEGRSAFVNIMVVSGPVVDRLPSLGMESFMLEHTMYKQLDGF